MSDAYGILEGVLGHWSAEDKLAAVLEYLDRQGVDEAFHDFLLEQKGDEIDLDFAEFDKSEVSKRYGKIREQIFDLLTEIKAGDVTIEYSGEGDEGAYDDPETEGQVDLNKYFLSDTFGDDIYVEKITRDGQRFVTLKNAIDALVEAWGYEFYPSWYDGSGASGSIVFHTKERYVEWNHGVYTNEQSWDQLKL